MSIESNNYTNECGSVVAVTGEQGPPGIVPPNQLASKLERGSFQGDADDLNNSIIAAANGIRPFTTLADANAYYTANPPAEDALFFVSDTNTDYTRFASGNSNSDPRPRLQLEDNGVIEGSENAVKSGDVFDYVKDTFKITGKNKYNSDLAQAGFAIQNGTGVIQAGANNLIWLGYISAIENQLYTLSRATGNLTRVHFYDSDLNWLGEVPNIALVHTFTTPANCAFVSSWGVLGADTFEVFKSAIQLELGGQKTEYEAFNISFTPDLFTQKSITVLKDGDNLYTRTSFSATQDLVQKFNAFQNELFLNNVIGFRGVWLVSKSASNDVSSYEAGSRIATQGDDAAPIQYNQSFIGGNHGHSRMRIVTANGHGKTSVDIGSRYTNGASGTWHIVRVVDANTLWMIGTNSGTDAIWNFQATLSGTLTHTSGGTNTANLIIGSATVGQLQPSVRSITKKILIDNNVEIIADGVYSTNKVNMVDNYEIVNVSILINTLVANAGTAYTDKQLDAAFRTGATSVSIDYTYNVQSNGAIVIYSPTRNHTEIDITYFGGVQAALTGSGILPTRLFYVPKALPITVGSATYDFRNREDLTNLPTGQIDFDRAIWEDPNSPPERLVQYLRTTSNVVKVGFAIGYDLSKGDGKPEVRKDLTDSALVIFTSLKSYPRIFDDKLGNVSQNSYFQTVSYRHFFDASIENTDKANATNFYHYKVGNDVMVVIDYHQTASFDSLKLPSEFLGKTIEVVEKSSNMTIHSTEVADTGVVLSVGAGIYGYATLKLN